MNKVQAGNLPAKLRESGLFCCWRYEARPGTDKPTKVPYNPRTGGGAQSTNPSTFAPLAVALDAMERGGYDGIGVGIFNGLGAIDIDHCISETGEFSEMATDIASIMGAYVERSPSGKGLRFLFTVPEGFQYDKARYYINNQKLGLEIYIAGATRKYVTVTGDALIKGMDLVDCGEQLTTVLEKYMVRPQKAAPAPTRAVDLDDAELIERAKRSKNGATFAALWSGDTTGYKSHSEADVALCNMLAFWANKDAGRMDGLFRASGLMREKWDRRQSGSTYGALTIQNAISTTRVGYDPQARTDRTALEWEPGSFVGFVGEAGQENENGFSGFLGFSGPDVKKNPQFPAAEFPRVLRNFAVNASDSLRVSVDMTSVSVLTVSSLCAQRKFMVHIRGNWFEPVNLYAVIIANPSERKSAELSLTMTPVYRYQHEENERRRPHVEEYNTRRDMLQRRIESMKKSASSGRKAKNDSPATVDDIMLLYREMEDLERGAINYVSLTADDITMEALASEMAANHETMSLVSSEGGIFNVLSGLYSGGMVNIDIILKAWSGDHVKVNRKGRQPETLSRPSLVILLMIQPRVLEAVMKSVDFAGRGLNARFLYSIPASPVGSRPFDAPSIPQDVMDEYDDLIYRLLSIPDTGEPRVIELTDEARNELRNIHNKIEPRLVGDLEPLGDWGGKYVGTVARIAGLLHICDHVEKAADIPMPGETIRRAGRIGEYFLAHAICAYQMAGQADDQPTKDAKYILKRLDSTGKTEISKSELQQLCKERVGLETAERMEPGLDVLVKRGYIKIEKDTTSKNPENPKKGGRPSWMVYVNPIYTAMKNEENRVS